LTTSIKTNPNKKLICPKCKSDKETWLSVICVYDAFRIPSVDTESWIECKNCGFEDILEKNN
jgi:predicted Zn-ribbon and HTH transcriptional regulator